MRYLSTRGAAPVLGFDDVLLVGLASDGGLYVPAEWPAAPDVAGLAFPELVAAVMQPYVGGTIAPVDLLRLAREAYAGFDHAAVAPLKQLDHRTWLLELFHGPTLAFKDYALQVVGRLFDHVLAARGNRITVIGATSGDTGSAAIEACRDRAAVDIFMLHPHGRVSEVQRRQMTTVDAANVFNLAIDGSFDDCQDLVKALFADAGLRAELSLAAVNSINWARIAAQVAYYVAAAAALGATAERPVAFSVPSGNFGNVYAAYAARQMGAPIGRLVVGSNRNDILYRFFASGTMRTETVVPSLSPSMDIQISSNFERLLFALMERDGAKVKETMQSFRATGAFSVSPQALERARAVFAAARLDDDGIRATIAKVHAETGEIVDPHTAIGIAAARAAPHDGPVVCLGCAHPAKFPDAVEAAIGIRPGLPARLADLHERREHVSRLPNELGAVRAFIRDHARILKAAA